MAISGRRAVRIVCAALSALGLTALVSGVAWAFFTSTGSGGAFATTGTLNPPTNVTVPASSAGTIAVSWTAPAGTPSATGYNITRTNTGTATTVGVCGTPAAPVTTTSCTDTAVPLGTYTYMVTAIYRSWTAVSAASSGITVTAPKLAFTTQPSNSVAGVPISPAIGVTLEDGAGNPVATAGVSVNLSIGTNPGSGSLSGTATATTNASGTATFSGLSVNKTGTGYTLTASSSLTPSVNSAAFTISAAAPSKLVFTTTVSGNQTATATATIGPFAVQAQDAFGNPSSVGASAVTVALSSNSSGTTFFTPTSGGGSATAVTIASGASASAAFYYADNRAGVPTLTATATVNAVALTPVTTTVTVVPAAVNKLVLPATFSGTATSSAAMGPITVTEADSFGNAVTASSAVAVALSSNSTGTSGFATTSGGTAVTSVRAAKERTPLFRGEL